MFSWKHTQKSYVTCIARWGNSLNWQVAWRCQLFDFLVTILFLEPGLQEYRTHAFEREQRMNSNFKTYSVTWILSKFFVCFAYLNVQFILDFHNFLIDLYSMDGPLYSRQLEVEVVELFQFKWKILWDWIIVTAFSGHWKKWRWWYSLNRVENRV